MQRPRTRRVRFHGHIAGVGTTEGTRIVIGHWRESPLGAFADAMVERPDGHRLLLAPHPDVARFVAATYEFDEIRIESFEVTSDPSTWRVRSTSLSLDLTLGARTAAGRVLALIPTALATRPWWCALTDSVARRVMKGVRTRGEMRGRREWYGASANHHVTALRGTLDGVDLGALAPVTPPPRFGFSSTPPAPSVTAVVTTIELDAATTLTGPDAPP